MIIGILKTLFNLAWTILKWPLIICGAIMLAYYLLCMSWILYYRLVKKIPKKKGEHYKVKEPKLLKKLFIDTPRQFAKDLAERDPEDFRPFGLILYTGNQGGGKTSSMIRDTRNLQTEYPKCKVIGNLDYKFQDDELKDWKQIIDYKNDKKGVIIQIDEIQNWFNSKASKDFPPEMTQVVTTNRKQRRVIMGTAQRFYMIAKDIRTQVTEVRNCTTLFGCLTIVHRQKPIINADGEVEKMKSLGWYCWVHNKKIRESYDTYKVIETLVKTGFVPRNEQLKSFDSVNTKIKVSNEKTKKSK